jgi:nicotinic acid mononucleotide adenylyltransferase
MRTYRSLIESLPSNTVVFAFGRFNPPTIGHQLLVQFVKNLAQRNRADYVIYASRTQDAKKNPLPLDRKLHYLNLMFPNTNFVGTDNHVRTFIEAAKQLNSKYSNLIMVAGSDRVGEYDRLLNKYNGIEFHFDSVKVISAGDRDPDSDDVSGMSASKMRALAAKGDFAQFRKGVPSTVRDIDARRLMNDVREGMGLDAIKEQITLPLDTVREKYFRGTIYRVGEIVESLNGEQFEIVKRGTNHLLVKDQDGNMSTKWLHEVLQREQQ